MRTMLQTFDMLVEQQRDELSRQLSSFDIPAVAIDQAQSELALSLAGVRVGLASWTPRPPITTEDEMAALITLVDELVTAQTNEVVASVLAKRDAVAGKARARLQAWNRERDALREVVTAAARAEMSEPTDDFDHMTIETLEDGTFRPRYRVKPSRD